MFNTRNKRYGLLGVILVDSIVLLLLLLLGLNYLVPPEEKGVLIRFGTASVGSNKNKTPNKVPIIKKDKKDIKEKKEVTKKPKKKDNKKEKLLTQNTKSDVLEKKKDSTVKKKKIKPKANEMVKNAIKSFATNKKPSKSVASAVSNILKEGKDGRGDDDKKGDKGSNLGSLNVDNYVGTGKGKSGNYRLGNRRVLEKVKPIYECTEEGTVVVNIWVNNKGDVIKAEPGAKGTTNPDSCLFKISKIAAMNTKWEAIEDESVSIQEGQIIYNFKITK